MMVMRMIFPVCCYDDDEYDDIVYHCDDDVDGDDECDGFECYCYDDDDGDEYDDIECYCYDDDVDEYDDLAEHARD